MKGKLAAFALLVVAGLLAAPGLAQAAPGDPVWVPGNDGTTVVDAHRVKLKDGNTSLEAANLGMDIPFGAPVSFKYVLGDGVTCGGGAPRVFVEVGGVYFNSFDGNPDQCGGEDGVVTFTVGAAGTIGHAGVVFDSGQQGTVTVKNLKVNGTLIDFTAVEPTPEPTATPTPTTEPTTDPTTDPTVDPTVAPTTDPTTDPEPTATADPEPTATATVAPVPTTPGSSPTVGAGGAGGSDSGKLPLTGAPLVWIGTGGLALVAGGLMLVWVLRRKSGEEDLGDTAVMPAVR